MSRLNRAAVRGGWPRVRLRGWTRGAVASAAALALVALGAGSPARAATGAPVAGAGSTGVQNPIDHWRFTAGGSGPGMATARGRTLGAFASLALCDQDSSTYLGNAPLPPSLVGNGLGTAARVPGAVPGDADTSGCVTSAAAALRSAPEPRACDRVGVPPCDGVSSGGHEQSIETTVEPGALVISIEGSPHVELPAPVLDPSGEHLHTSGRMTPVTVTDSRPGNISWTASGQSGDFAGPAGTSIPASGLTWAPEIVNRGNVREVTAGPAVLPGDGEGLGRARTLATGAGPGTTDVGAGLDLDAPAGARPGTYTAVLTLTVI